MAKAKKKVSKQINNFALNPDALTLAQFEACTKQGYVVRVALMPDAHVGYVAPIGAVLTTKYKLKKDAVGLYEK